MQRGARSIINVIHRFWACTEKRSHHIDEATSENEKEVVLFHTMMSYVNFAGDKQKKSNFCIVKVSALELIQSYCPKLKSSEIFGKWCGNT